MTHQKQLYREVLRQTAEANLIVASSYNAVVKCEFEKLPFGNWCRTWEVPRYLRLGSQNKRVKTTIQMCQDIGKHNAIFDGYANNENGHR